MNGNKKRVCKNKDCNRIIDHLPEKYKYCTLSCRETHHHKAYCKKVKKFSVCIVCSGKYDLVTRGRKRTCSDSCEAIQRETASKKVYYTKKGNCRECERCGECVKSKTFKLCERCRAINSAMIDFKGKCNG